MYNKVDRLPPPNNPEFNIENQNKHPQIRNKNTKEAEEDLVHIDSIKSAPLTPQSNINPKKKHIAKTPPMARICPRHFPQTTEVLSWFGWKFILFARPGGSDWVWTLVCGSFISGNAWAGLVCTSDAMFAREVWDK